VDRPELLLSSGPFGPLIALGDEPSDEHAANPASAAMPTNDRA
jgi:hypothetical protein